MIGFMRYGLVRTGELLGGMSSLKGRSGQEPKSVGEVEKTFRYSCSTSSSAVMTAVVHPGPCKSKVMSRHAWRESIPQVYESSRLLYVKTGQEFGGMVLGGPVWVAEKVLPLVCCQGQVLLRQVGGEHGRLRVGRGRRGRRRLVNRERYFRRLVALV